jgi:hypothetical protein
MASKIKASNDPLKFNTLYWRWNVFAYGLLRIVLAQSYKNRDQI